MNNDETLKVEVQMELERIAELQKNKEEFYKLGLNVIGLRNYLIFLVPYALLMVVYALFEIESELFQILCLVFFVISIVQGMITTESRKTNRRIDLLLSILKQEQK